MINLIKDEGLRLNPVFSIYLYYVSSFLSYFISTTQVNTPKENQLPQIQSKEHFVTTALLQKICANDLSSVGIFE